MVRKSVLESRVWSNSMFTGWDEIENRPETMEFGWVPPDFPSKISDMCRICRKLT